MGVNAWVLFPTEMACQKAFKQLESKTVNGKKLTVDFCGKKSKNFKPKSNGNNI